MKVAVIGASGKTGIKVVREALHRGYQVVAVCRQPSLSRLEEFSNHKGFTVVTAPVVSDEAALTSALAGCDAVVAVLISVRLSFKLLFIIILLTGYRYIGAVKGWCL